MKVWLYYRLSRDEDDELNSLTNQRKIIYEYAVTNGHEVVGESFDDNVSGMHFNREGIDKIYEAVEAGKVEAIIVKDLSRLGRHRTQTALFIDYLREHDVRVLSATENIDTFNENDDLIIGFKGLVNDFYARDGSRRVRTGYRQKQKEGLVTIPPFGYFKDKNTKKVVIVEEAEGRAGDHAAFRILERQKYKSGFGASGGSKDGAAYLRSVLAGLRTKRNCPQAQQSRAQNARADHDGAARLRQPEAAQDP